MQKWRVFALLAAFIFFILLAMVLALPYAVIAQDADVGTPPRIITPGQSLSSYNATVVPTLPYTECYPALPLQATDLIYIKPGVNIRAAADGSSAIVWNTMYNQVDENGNALDENELFNLEAYIISGPVCVSGYNWWHVDLAYGNDGWVSEGRPNEPGSYLFLVAGIDFDQTCTPIFELLAGEIATISQNVRVREEPNLNARVRTVAPVGADVLIIQGPQCDVRTGTVWFEVQVTVANFQYQGWMSQGLGGAVWLIPTDLPSEEAGTLCGPPLGFSLGDLGYVNPPDERPRYLRLHPGLNAEVAFLLVDGVPFEIIGGPSCVNNINWWQIRVLSSFPVTGWIAEGSRSAYYWLSPIDPDEFAN